MSPLNLANARIQAIKSALYWHKAGIELLTTPKLSHLKQELKATIKSYKATHNPPIELFPNRWAKQDDVTKIA